MSIHVSTDHEHDVHVLHLSDEPVARTAHVGDACLIDLDAEGRPVAVEILVPGACDLESLAKEFGFEDRLGEADSALSDAGVRLGATPTSIAVATASATTWTQTNAVTSSQQIPAQSIDLIPA